MFGKKRVPVLRIDRLKEAAGGMAAAGDAGAPAVPAGAIRYTLSAEPESSYPLANWEALPQLVRSLGSGEDRVGVRFTHSGGARRVAAEAFGAARLDRLYLRWSDTGLKSKAAPPWYFAVSAPTGTLTRVPLGDVPPDFDELNPDDYEQFPGLDLAAVPAESVVSVTDAVQALQWFLHVWPEESSPALDWVSR